MKELGKTLHSEEHHKKYAKLIPKDLRLDLIQSNDFFQKKIDQKEQLSFKACGEI